MLFAWGFLKFRVGCCFSLCVWQGVSVAVDGRRWTFTFTNMQVRPIRDVTFYLLSKKMESSQNNGSLVCRHLFEITKAKSVL